MKISINYWRISCTQLRNTRLLNCLPSFSNNDGQTADIGFHFKRSTTPDTKEVLTTKLSQRNSGVNFLWFSVSRSRIPEMIIVTTVGRLLWPDSYAEFHSQSLPLDVNSTDRTFPSVHWDTVAKKGGIEDWSMKLRNGFWDLCLASSVVLILTCVLCETPCLVSWWLETSLGSLTLWKKKKQLFPPQVEKSTWPILHVRWSIIL